MKRTLITAAMALLTLSATAQTIVVENTFHKFNGARDSSLYNAVGVSQTTDFGTFDAYWQGVRSWGEGYKDHLNGFEVGYGRFIEFGSITVNPRLALGTMGNINVGDRDAKAKYALLSVEGTTRLSESVGAYVSVSHMNGLNDDAISASNRVQAGVDLTLSPKVGVRVGTSVIRQLNTAQRGIVSMLFYTF